MLKKLIAGTTLALAMVTMAAPSASAANWVVRNTFPTENDAITACNYGKFNHWWDTCAYRAVPRSYRVTLLTNR